MPMSERDPIWLRVAAPGDIEAGPWPMASRLPPVVAFLDPGDLMLEARSAHLVEATAMKPALTMGTAIR